MKMLLIIFLKISHNVIEVMVVLMVPLLALKLVQRYRVVFIILVLEVMTCGVCTLPSFLLGGGGLNLLPNFLKGDLDWISIFRKGLLGKRG